MTAIEQGQGKKERRRYRGMAAGEAVTDRRVQLRQARPWSLKDQFQMNTATMTQGGRRHPQAIHPLPADEQEEGGQGSHGCDKAEGAQVGDQDHPGRQTGVTMRTQPVTAPSKAARPPRRNCQAKKAKTSRQRMAAQAMNAIAGCNRAHRLSLQEKFAWPSSSPSPTDIVYRSFLNQAKAPV